MLSKKLIPDGFDVAGYLGAGGTAIKTNVDASYGWHHFHIDCISKKQADNIAAQCGDDFAALRGIEGLSEGARDELVRKLQEKRGFVFTSLAPSPKQQNPKVPKTAKVFVALDKSSKYKCSRCHSESRSSRATHGC